MPPLFNVDIDGSPIVVKTEKRENDFASLDEAARILRSKKLYRTWDETVFQRYLEHGLKKVEKVERGIIKHVYKLRCDPLSEAEVFRRGPFHGVHERLHEISIPVHLLYGELSREWAESSSSRASLRLFPQHILSSRAIKGATHSLPMEQPLLVSQHLIDVSGIYALCSQHSILLFSSLSLVSLSLSLSLTHTHTPPFLFFSILWSINRLTLLLFLFLFLLLLLVLSLADVRAKGKTLINEWLWIINLKQVNKSNNNNKMSVLSNNKQQTSACSPTSHSWIGFS